MSHQEVADVMTRDVVALEPDEDLRGIRAQMDRFGCRHLPVVGPERRLLGLVSHRDLLGWTASRLFPYEVSRTLAVETLFTVSAVMTRDVETCRPRDLLSDVAQRMLESKHGCVPVVDEDRRLVGIITEHDLLKVLVGLLRLDEDHLHTTVRALGRWPAPQQ